MPSVAIVGASGRLGQFFKLALPPIGYPIELEISRDDLSATDISGTYDFVLLAVSDSAITEVAEQLALQPANFSTAVHFSGVATSQLLWPLSAKGCTTGSFHPVHSFSDPKWSAENFAGSYVTIEGDASQQLFTLAEALNANPLSIEPTQKAKYHAATALAANGVSALANTAIRILKDALPQDANPEIAAALLLPMMHTVIDKTEALGNDSLTGPVARGDLSTVAKHIAALNPEDIDLYKTLSKAMLDLVEDTTEKHKQIKHLLD